MQWLWNAGVLGDGEIANRKKMHSHENGDLEFVLLSTCLFGVLYDSVVVYIIYSHSGLPNN